MGYEQLTIFDYQPPAINFPQLVRNNAKYNQRAYNDARELSALVSLAEYGNGDISKKAKRIIKSI